MKKRQTDQTSWNTKSYMHEIFQISSAVHLQYILYSTIN